MESRGQGARGVVYALLNALNVLAAGFGVAQGNASAGSALYGILLVMLCSVPILWLRRFNDRYGILAVFMGCYFMMFGALSLQTLLIGSEHLQVADSAEFITAAQVGVLLGAALVLAGYRIGASLVPPVPEQHSATDWSNSAILLVGLAAWLYGAAASAFYSLVVSPENSVAVLRMGMAQLGPTLTFLMMAGFLVQPLGVVILAYGYAKNRTRFWLLLAVSMVVAQMFLGFITDTKEAAALGILLLALTQTLWDNKIPRGWSAGVVVFALLVFPVLQAARVERGEHGLNRAQALERFGDMLVLAWQSHEKQAEGAVVEHHTQTLLERVSLEGPLEPVFRSVGSDTPFLHGSTLVALPYAFIPRILLPDKEDVPVGQLYNRTFNHAGSDDFTYVSFSMLGEFYWNFGWPGVIVGMTLAGLIMGYTGARSNLAEVRSVTRLLIALVTIKALCLGFERGVGMSYVVWLRGIAAVGLLHLVFSRASASAAGATSMEVSTGPAIAATPLYPNLLR